MDAWMWMMMDAWMNAWMNAWMDITIPMVQRKASQLGSCYDATSCILLLYRSARHFALHPPV
jgi:hypothetical protein